jgi:hypothetical protein
VEECGNIKNALHLIIQGQAAIFHTKMHPTITFQPFNLLLQKLRRLFQLEKCPQKRLSPRHLPLVNEVEKIANVIGRNFLSLRQVVCHQFMQF